MSQTRTSSIRTRLLLVGIGLPLLLVGVLFVLYGIESQQDIKQAYVDKSRAITLAVEAAREQSEKAWEDGVYTVEMMREAAESGERDRVLSMVPVVTAWRVAEMKAEEGGYQFRVPKFYPRNPENEPDEVEAAALEYMKFNNLDKHYVIDKERNTVRYFRSIKLTQNCLNCHGDPANSQALWGNNQGLDPTGSRMEGWKVGEHHGAFEIIQSLDEADAQLAQSNMIASILVIGGLGVLGFVFWNTANGITSRLRDTSGALQKLAEGDLTSSLEVKQRDEVGLMQESLNETSRKLRLAFGRIGESVTTLLESSSSLKGSAQRVADGSENLDHRVNSVAAAGEELSSTVMTMAATAEELSASAHNVAASVEELNASIAEVSHNCTRESEMASEANRDVRAAGEVMNRLGESAAETGKIVDLIRNIAEQTNLLALNATIEAASAGEAGKGFAVVANEVKELARQSASASEQIAQQIEAMQTDARESVHGMEKVTDIIERLSQVAVEIATSIDQQTRTVNEVAGTISGVSGATNELAENINATAAGSNEVSTNMTEVSAISRDASAEAHGTRERAGQLEQLAAELRDITATFRLN